MYFPVERVLHVSREAKVSSIRRAVLDFIFSNSPFIGDSIQFSFPFPLFSAVVRAGIPCPKRRLRSITEPPEGIKT